MSRLILSFYTFYHFSSLLTCSDISMAIFDGFENKYKNALIAFLYYLVVQ